MYDFSSSKRVSYYPHNQPIVGTGNESDTDRTLAQSTTDTIIPTATIVERSQAGSPMLESEAHHHLPSLQRPTTP